MRPYGKNRCESRNKKKRKIEGNRREGERKKEHEAKGAKGTGVFASRLLTLLSRLATAWRCMFLHDLLLCDVRCDASETGLV